MSVQRKLYLLAGLLLLAGLGATFLAGLDWSPVIAEVRWHSKVERVESHAEALRFAARESGHDPYLLAGLMYVESGGDPAAVSSASALGLMQLKEATAAEQATRLGLREAPTRETLLADSLLNVRLGAAYLRWLLEYRDGDLEHALVSYNAGPGNVNQWTEEEGWEAWRDRRRAAGDSKVLRYARDVVRFGERFRARGRIAGPDGVPSGGLGGAPGPGPAGPAGDAPPAERGGPPGGFTRPQAGD